MWVAGIITLIGVSLSYLVGVRNFGQGTSDILLAILASCLAAFVCLPVTLYAQRNPRLKVLTQGTIKSWILLSSLYFIVLLGICPWLRDPTTMALMFIPLLMCTGVTIIVYGPLHDRIIRRTQERTKLIR